MDSFELFVMDNLLARYPGDLFFTHNLMSAKAIVVPIFLLSI